MLISLANMPNDSWSSGKGGCLGVGLMLAAILVAAALIFSGMDAVKGLLPGQSPGATPGPRGWSGTLTYKTGTMTVESGPATRHEASNSYEVIARLWSSGGEGSWTILGEAKVVYTAKDLFKTHTDDGVNPPCDTVVTTDVNVSETVDVEGFLDITDMYFQFSLGLPEVEGQQETTNDDSGCAGSKTIERNPYLLGSNSLGGEGQQPNARTITMSRVEPITNPDGSKTGETVITLNLTYNP